MRHFKKETDTLRKPQRSRYQIAAVSILLMTASYLAHGTETEPKLQLDTKPLPIEGHLITSYAPAIGKASPSVVYVYTTKKTDTRQAPSISPLLNDPFLRRFFQPPSQQRSEPREEHGLGSGVIISSDGYILTNNHVVDDADEVEVHTAEKTYSAKLIGADPQTDIALLKIDASGLPPIVIADSDALQVGDIVLAIGNPFGVGKTVTMGIVSATGRSSLHLADYENFIQTDAAINPGNSGGALIDATGRLVGINTAIFSRSGGNQGIGFAIPTNLVRSVMQSIVEHGKVLRGYLGVSIQAVTPDLAKAFGVDQQTGALVGEVVPNTPADRAGLREGDVVVELDGKPVKDSAEFRLNIAQKGPDKMVRLKLIRDGKPRMFDVRLGLLEQEMLTNDERTTPQEHTHLSGVIIADITAKERLEFSIPDHIKGALVMDISLNSPAFKGGLRSGNVITSVDRQPVSNAREATRLVKEFKRQSILLRVWGRGNSRFIVLNKTQ